MRNVVKRINERYRSFVSKTVDLNCAKHLIDKNHSFDPKFVTLHNEYKDSEG